MNFKRLAITSLLVTVLFVSSTFPAAFREGGCVNTPTSSTYSWIAYVLYLGGKKACEVIKEKAAAYFFRASGN